MPLEIPRRPGEQVVITTASGERIVVELCLHPRRAAGEPLLVIDAPHTARVVRGEHERPAAAA